MAKVTVEIPDDVVPILPGAPDGVGPEILLAAAIHWCRRGDMTTSQAARLAGLTYAEFLEAAAQRKSDLYDYDPEEIRDELSRPLPEGVDPERTQQDLARAQSARR